MDDMTSRERVLRSLAFEGPDRLPLAKGEDADLAFVGYGSARGFAPSRSGLNEWGCVWRSLNPSAGDQGQVSEHPLGDWHNIRDFRFPDPFAAGRMDEARAKIDSLRRDGKFVCASLGKGPMHLLDDLRGFEGYLMDLITEPERVELLLDGIFGFLVGMVEQFGGLGVDAVFLTDDQAMQSGPLFSMDIWRERFKPRYRELFNLAHEAGCKVYLHSDGRANSAHGDGVLALAEPGDEPCDRFAYDPLAPVPTAGGPHSGNAAGSADPVPAGPCDQAEVEQRHDVLVYSTAPLEADLDVIGPLSLHLTVASSAPDTDFTGKLVDVHPDGRAYILSDGIVRLSFRESSRAPSPVVAGRVYELDIDLGVTAN